ncbi:hypothetical protein [Spiroplasma endosymbiont of Villa modesta]|uniref:hypothetical protein n=1 Tax=Spiroplasma endosymbiont of Villa modesta TaxID=3066293 RepID=UPI00313CDEEB
MKNFYLVSNLISSLSIILNKEIEKINLRIWDLGNSLNFIDKFDFEIIDFIKTTSSSSFKKVNPILFKVKTVRDILEQTSNYTLTKILRTGLSPLSAMVGVSAYYGQYLKDPILGSINSLLFSKKLGIDIWNINQRPTTKNKVINSYKKIFLGLGTIGLINYSKFVQYVDKSVSLLRDATCHLPLSHLALFTRPLI